MPYDFTVSTGYWITLTAHHYQHRVDAELRPYNITFRQFQVICWLKCEGPLTQSALAKRLFVEPPTLAGILARMEAMNWITRTDCPIDRRKKFIDVGPAAEPVWEKISDILVDVREQAVEGLTHDEVDQLHHLLSRVLHNLGGTPLPTTPSEVSTVKL